MSKFKKTTLGFFGDSFCADKITGKLLPGYETYIQKLSKSYEITNLGYGGSSVWDLLLHQLNPKIRSGNLPDVCILVWTLPGRLFHEKIRRINSSSAFEKNKLIWHTAQDYFIPDSKAIWQAAREYYKYFSYPEKDEIEYISLLQYIDNNILPSLINNQKIIHLWSYGQVKEWNDNGFSFDNCTYHYRWKNGVEIRPSLASIGMINYTFEQFMNSDDPNHLSGDLKNHLVHDIIQTAIKNYESGKLFDNTNLIKDFYK